MTDLIAELQRQIDRKSDVRLLDAVATGSNTVVVGGSTVAVTLPAIIPVTTGQFCQVLEQGANRVIVGPASSSGNAAIGGNLTVAGTTTLTGALTVAGLPVTGAGSWTTISLLSPNWTQTRTPEWRINGARVELRGSLARINTTYTTGTSLFNLPTGTTPSQNYTTVATASIAALTPDRYAYSWIARSTGTFDSLATGPDVAPADTVDLDGISWPVA